MLRVSYSGAQRRIPSIGIATLLLFACPSVCLPPNSSRQMHQKFWPAALLRTCFVSSKFLHCAKGDASPSWASITRGLLFQQVFGCSLVRHVFEFVQGLKQNEQSEESQTLPTSITTRTVCSACVISNLGPLSIQPARCLLIAEIKTKQDNPGVVFIPPPLFRQRPYPSTIERVTSGEVISTYIYIYT